MSWNVCSINSFSKTQKNSNGYSKLTSKVKALLRHLYRESNVISKRLWLFCLTHTFSINNFFGLELSYEGTTSEIFTQEIYWQSQVCFDQREKDAWFEVLSTVWLLAEKWILCIKRSLLQVCSTLATEYAWPNAKLWIY